MQAPEARSTHGTGAPRPRDAVSKLIFELSKLPGIGEKTATRLAYFILKQDAAYSRALAESLLDAKQKTGLCSRCYTFTDHDPCRICAEGDSGRREAAVICVVERPSDVLAIEQSKTPSSASGGGFRGVYHVLHGALSPLDGIGPEDLKISELLSRIGATQPEEIAAASPREVILATNPSVEGEATALYLARLLKPLGLRVTKLAHGLPVGGLLEYADRQTIGKAMDNRMEIV